MQIGLLTHLIHTKTCRSRSKRSNYNNFNCGSNSIADTYIQCIYSIIDPTRRILIMILRLQMMIFKFQYHQIILYIDRYRHRIRSILSIYNTYSRYNHASLKIIKKTHWVVLIQQSMIIFSAVFKWRVGRPNVNMASKLNWICTYIR